MKKISGFIGIAWILFVVTFLVVPATGYGAVRYATPAGTGDCSSWASACALQTALTGAASGYEIWVAAGTYKPTSDINRSATFQLKSGVAIYGGFAGTETDRSQRNWATNVTTLSGDLTGNDSGTTYNDENSYHVVTGATGAILDGVTITGGNANGGGYPNYMGGGMYNDNSSPTLTNVTFSNNSTSYIGGGIANYTSSPTLTNVTFSNNSASNFGGGMYNDNSSSPTLTNVTFSNNLASYGGGMYNYFSNPIIRNSILWGDSGGEIYNGLISTPDVTYSDVQGGYTGTGNINSDPYFVNAAAGNLHLRADSPAKNVGNNTVANPGLPATDLDGNPRIVYNTVDMGAYEFVKKVYVNSAATGSNNGTSWIDAYPDVQSALAASVNGDEIWVAAGTYKPTSGGDRSATFQLKSGVAIYGGFAGTETDRSQRNWATNVTTLSGDLTGDDSGFTNNGENSYHVVTGVTGAILDGVTITGGNANGSYPDNIGGGMYNLSSSPTLTNVTFSNNSASVYGGGMYNHTSSSPTLTNVTFSNNSASEGGGMYNSSSSPTLTIVTFSNNSASGFGGGMYNGVSNPTLTIVTFSNNSAGFGGGMYNGVSNPTLTIVTFSNNSAGSGGGMYNGVSSPTLTNVTFSNNSASSGGGGMYNYNSHPIIRNSILWGDSGGEIGDGPGSTPNITYSVVQGGYAGTGNINSDPLLGTLGNHGGSTLTIPLLPGSSAIHTGNATYCPPTDQRGKPRVGTCDIGAFESQGFTLTNTGGDSQGTAINTVFTNPLALTVAANNTGEPVNGGVITFTAPASGASSNPVTTNATIAGGAVSQSITANGTAGGPYTVTASATGAAPTVSYSLTNMATQTIGTITFNPATLNVGGTTTVSATATSGLAVTFSSLSTSVCTVSGTTVTGVTAGPCTIAADQAGNSDYTVAPRVSQDITVDKVSALVSLSNLNATYDGSAKAATATTTPSGLAVSLTYDGSATPPTNAGDYAVVATISDLNYNGSASGTLTIAKADQSITLAATATKTYGAADFGPGGSATSGLLLSYSSNTPAVATITGGGLVHIVGQGSATITANQAGDANYNAAPPKTMALRVVANSYPLTIIKTGKGTVTSTSTGISCGTDCTEEYDYDTEVTLIATPAGGTFTGWSGGGCTGIGECTVTMDAQKEITATFKNPFPWLILMPGLSHIKEK